jgi:16S rRNA (uracil1498-N3)-methyltransferase
VSEPFFYFADLSAAGEQVTLTGDEAQHAAGARRLRAGETLVLFDGHGLSATATLVALRDRGRELDLRLGERHAKPPPRPAVTLACALPKGDRLATMLDMATQLGMSSFTPLRCERGVVEPSAANLARMHRLCLEACKQSRRAWLPRIGDPDTVAAVAARSRDDGACLVLAQPGGQPWSALARAPDQPLTFLVGPEGGFTDQEVGEARAAGAQAVGLGDAILRIETAAVALLALAVLARET